MLHSVDVCIGLAISIFGCLLHLTMRFRLHEDSNILYVWLTHLPSAQLRARSDQLALQCLVLFCAGPVNFFHVVLFDLKNILGCGAP